MRHILSILTAALVLTTIPTTAGAQAKSDLRIPTSCAKGKDGKCQVRVDTVYRDRRIVRIDTVFIQMPAAPPTVHVVQAPAEGRSEGKSHWKRNLALGLLSGAALGTAAYYIDRNRRGGSLSVRQCVVVINNGVPQTTCP